ncbi:cis-aconitate decarboxylase-like [Littorina saxatilis]|uniref:Cis-aconitate decarboxylase n=1 Tax=Littorina saxatilis TaxID=31220 RepID=A0AAN9B6H7_9CAEN
MQRVPKVTNRVSEFLRSGYPCNCAASRRQSSTALDTTLPLDTQQPAGRSYAHVAIQPIPVVSPNLPATSVTTWISDLASNTTLSDLSDVTVARSKRMILDTLGVGFLGYKTDITATVTRCTLNSYNNNNNNNNGADTITKEGEAGIWGAGGLTAPPSLAAYINGISVHSMDFDDTWYPATHPSGPVLPAVMALAESMPKEYRPTLTDLLVAYNVGIQVQGLLLLCSDSAKSIPDRFHPPAVVGVMGSAAACARLLGGSPTTVRHALAIATSFAGAPMANAGTTTKPLHAGKAARFGLEAALLADHGMEGNHDILDMNSGFGAFYHDYDPEGFLLAHSTNRDFILHDQDIALKRYPAHLGMHWTIDAVLAVREKIAASMGPNRKISPDDIKIVHIRAPPSKYINRPLPSTTHEARHSFQFTACTALLDGEVTPDSFMYNYRRRPQLHTLLRKTTIETPLDNVPTFMDMYVEVEVTMKNGEVFHGRCDTPYGHWRHPLTKEDLEKKFLTNTKDLAYTAQQSVINTVAAMDTLGCAEEFLNIMKG